MKKHLPKSGMRLYTDAGSRLYLTPSKRDRFVKVANQQPPIQRTFCLMLAYTGCRLSEARFLGRYSPQLPEQIVAIRTLKRRDDTVMREVPIPPEFVHVQNGPTIPRPLRVPPISGVKPTGPHPGLWRTAG